MERNFLDEEGIQILVDRIIRGLVANNFFINNIRTVNEIGGPLAIECQILDDCSFQTDILPEGYNKTNSIMISNKAVFTDNSVESIAVGNVTYTDQGIFGIFSGAKKDTIKKLYIYLQKVDPIEV